LKRNSSITITNGYDTVTLLPGIRFSILPKRIAQSATMASGRVVMDIVGYKNVLSIPTGWLPADRLYVLIDMIKKNPYLTVEYPWLMEWKTGVFVFELPEIVAFRYDENGCDSLGVKLEAEEAEVSNAESL
jgi:hypothetical protein